MSWPSFGLYIVSMVLQILPPEKILVVHKQWCLDLLRVRCYECVLTAKIKYKKGNMGSDS